MWGFLIYFLIYFCYFYKIPSIFFLRFKYCHSCACLRHSVFSREHTCKHVYVPFSYGKADSAHLLYYLCSPLYFNVQVLLSQYSCCFSCCISFFSIYVYTSAHTHTHKASQISNSLKHSLHSFSLEHKKGLYSGRGN